VISHLRGYIRQFGEKGGADRIVIAHAKIGEILWHQSCPFKEIDGSCVKITRERAVASKKNKKKKGDEQPLQCGPESKIKLTVVKRDDRKLREALQEYKAAAQVYEKKQGNVGGDEARAKYYYAMAKFAEADVEFEKYLDVKFPTNLNFDPAPEHKAIREKSLKRFTDWITQKAKSAENTKAKYEKVFEVKDNANSIAAKARIGQIMQNFSDALFTAEIPKDVRTGEFADEKVEAYCDTLTEKAEPLAKTSLDMYGVCLSKSTELGWFSEWSKLCERELGQIKPEEFPTALELRGESNEVTNVIASEPPAKLE